MTRKLTEKQKAFADYYITSLNATESALKAGYSENTAGAIGHENLKKPKIRKYIDERLAEKETDRVAGQDEILEFMTAVMRSDIKYLKQVEPVDIRDRLKASEHLGKVNAMFTDKLEHSGEIEIEVKLEDI